MRGLPLAILCARRLMNSGMDVLLCTSEAASDDLLVETAGRHGIKVCRGSLDDVLSRFYGCTLDLKDGDVVVRMTADNPVPDGDFVAGLVREISARKLDYYATSSPRDGLPYGLSAEVMTVAALRAAHRNAAMTFDREHVTQWIVRHLRTGLVNGTSLISGRNLAHLRCTVDTLDEYLLMDGVFKNTGQDPVAVSWRELVGALERMPGSAAFRVPYRVRDGRAESVVTLGTAQLGLAYGIANRDGQPAEADAVEIVRTALAHGVNWIDTARAYGDAEIRVSHALAAGWNARARIVSKLGPLTTLPEDAVVANVDAHVDTSLYQSAHALGCRVLDVVLLHRWSHYSSHSGRIWRRLLEYRQAGFIKELGASLYEPREAIEALADPDIQQLQIPFNLLDHRWLEPDLQQALARRPDVRIHVRTVFLQGLLLHGGAIWPAWDDQASARMRLIDGLVEQLDRHDRADLCMAYVRGHPWVDSIVLGMETLGQLKRNLELACRPPLEPDQCKLVTHALAGAPARLLNPAKW
jgi:spore coat polysaccharide biosynthesis protein SpsF